MQDKIEDKAVKKETVENKRLIWPPESRRISRIEKAQKRR